MNKHILFVVIPMILLSAFMLLPLAVDDIEVPYDGVIMLVGSSIFGYSGVKGFGIYASAKKLPENDGIPPGMVKRMTNILIGLYCLIAEALFITFWLGTGNIPLDDLFTMAAFVSGGVLASSQLMKSGAKLNGTETAKPN